MSAQGRTRTVWGHVVIVSMTIVMAMAMGGIWLGTPGVADASTGRLSTNTGPKCTGHVTTPTIANGVIKAKATGQCARFRSADAPQGGTVFMWVHFEYYSRPYWSTGTMNSNEKDWLGTGPHSRTTPPMTCPNGSPLELWRASADIRYVIGDSANPSNYQGIILTEITVKSKPVRVHCEETITPVTY